MSSLWYEISEEFFFILEEFKSQDSSHGKGEALICNDKLRSCLECADPRGLYYAASHAMNMLG